MSEPRPTTAAATDQRRPHARGRILARAGLLLLILAAAWGLHHTAEQQARRSLGVVQAEVARAGFPDAVVRPTLEKTCPRGSVGYRWTSPRASGGACLGAGSAPVRLQVDHSSTRETRPAAEPCAA